MTSPRTQKRVRKGVRIEISFEGLRKWQRHAGLLCFLRKQCNRKQKGKKISFPVTFEEMCATVTQCLSYSLLSYGNLKTTSFCVFFFDKELFGAKQVCVSVSLKCMVSKVSPLFAISSKLLSLTSLQQVWQAVLKTEGPTPGMMPSN